MLLAWILTSCLLRVTLRRSQAEIHSLIIWEPCLRIWSKTLHSAVTITRRRVQAAGAHPLPTVRQHAPSRSLSLTATPAFPTSAVASGAFATTPSVHEFSSLTVSSATNRTASKINCTDGLYNLSNFIIEIKLLQDSFDWCCANFSLDK